MFRNVLTALVLASVSVACGGESTGPKVVAGAPAGDVTEVTGTVTATRDGKARPLAVGDVVSGDDVVSTGADGHVAIRLHHNLVPWSLGPGKTEQVSLSLAWKAPRATQTAAGPIGERSGAAGRHAEREAADTSATAAAPMQEKAAAIEAAATAGVLPPAPGAAPAPVAKADAPPPKPDPAPDEAMAAKTTMRDTKSSEKEIEEAFGAGGLGLSGAGEGGGGSGEGKGLGNIGTLGHGSGAGQGKGLGASGGGGGSIGLGAPRRPPDAKGTVKVFAVSGGLSASVVARVVRSRNARFLACVASENGSRAAIKLTIKPDGTVDQVTVTGVSTSATNCLVKWTRATSFPSEKTATSASLTVTAPLDL